MLGSLCMSAVFNFMMAFQATLNIIILKMQSLGWGHSSVGQVLALKA